MNAGTPPDVLSAAWSMPSGRPRSAAGFFSLLIVASSQLQPFHKFLGDRGDPLLCDVRERSVRLRMWIAQDDPQTRPIDIVVARTDRAGKLRKLQHRRRLVREIEMRVFEAVFGARRMSQQIEQHSARVIN